MIDNTFFCLFGGCLWRERERERQERDWGHWAEEIRSTEVMGPRCNRPREEVLDFIGILLPPV